MSTVAVFGHSFVRRARDSAIESYRQQQGLDYRNLNIRSDICRVIFHGIGGLTIPRAYNETEFLTDLSPDLIVLHIGENDVDSLLVDSPSTLAEDILDLALYIRQQSGAKGVVIAQLLPRVRPARLDYWERLVGVNRTLKTLCTSIDDCIYWPHKRGLWALWRDNFGADGVHLNHKGIQKYIRSLRGAVLQNLPPPDV